MSINSLFEISRRSFRAFDASTKAAGQNVANAGTEGYHRRRVSLRTANTVAPGLYTAPGPGTATGNGVTAASYERVRDGMLDRAAAQAHTGQGAAGEEARLLRVLEGAFATGTDAALPQAMESFWNGWSDVANHPGDRGVRSALLSKAESLTATFNGLGQSIERLEGETQAALKGSVGEVNARLDEVAGLNETIRAARANGSPDLAAEDRRDTLVKQLSAYVPVQVQEDEAAGYTLTVKGMSVVQGDESTPLTLQGTDVRFGDSDVSFRANGEGDGKLGAQARMAQDTLPSVRGELNDLAKKVVVQVNKQHRQGETLDGDTGKNFFKPGADFQKAGTMQLAVDDPGDVAATAPDAPGDSTPARTIAALSENLTPKAIDLAAGVGAQIERASAQADSQGALVDHLEGMARGVSGVSIDEEMTNLIEHQQSFAASARVLNTAQSLMDTLLSL